MAEDKNYIDGYLRWRPNKDEKPKEIVPEKPAKAPRSFDSVKRCPECHNIDKKRKRCLVCDGEGFVGA